MLKKILIAAFLIVVYGCTSMKVVPVDKKTGYFSGVGVGSAKIIKDVAMDLDSRKGRLLIGGSEFTRGMVKNIGYFDQVVTFDDLQKDIVRRNLADKIPSVSEKIGLSNAAKMMEPFLWLHGNMFTRDSAQYFQLILTDPLTLEDLFVSEVSYGGAIPNDQNTWYPSYNALIDYIKQNSNTYRKR